MAPGFKPRPDAAPTGGLSLEFAIAQRRWPPSVALTFAKTDAATGSRAQGRHHLTPPHSDASTSNESRRHEALTHVREGLPAPPARSPAAAASATSSATLTTRRTDAAPSAEQSDAPRRGRLFWFAPIRRSYVILEGGSSMRAPPVPYFAASPDRVHRQRAARIARETSAQREPGSVGQASARHRSHGRRARAALLARSCSVSA